MSVILENRRLALEPLKSHSSKIVALRAREWDCQLAARVMEESVRVRSEDERFE